MVLLWKNAAKVWRAKGHSNITIADALEAKFGVGKGLGRSTIAMLATTECEPCPPDVADFILNELAVLDEGTWARYLREEAKAPAEDPGPQPREVRDVARDAAAEFAATVRVWLEAAERKLEALMDGCASSVRGKLDVVERSVAHVDSRLEIIDARLERWVEASSQHPAETRRDGDTQRILRAVYGSAAFTVLVVISSCATTAFRQAPAADIRINVGREQIVSEDADEQQSHAAPGPIETKRVNVPSSGSERVGERKPPKPRRPATPVKGQAAPPCQAVEEAINGGCWVRTTFKPPCPPELFEHGNGCFIAILKDSADGVGGAGQ